ARWASQDRAAETARGRSRERWLRQQATEDATFIGVALDLAERRCPVTIRTANGRTVRGALVAVARDFWVVDTHGGPTLVAAGFVVSVRGLPGSDSGYGRPDARANAVAGEATGDRTDVLDMRLVDALAAIAGDRPRARLALVGDNEGMTGELRAV